MNQTLTKKLAQSIGRVARQARNARGQTQEDVAERVGISGEFYARIERGQALPSVQTLNGISLVLDVSIDMLLGRVGGPQLTLPATTVSEAASEDPPEIRRLTRRLRKAEPETIQVVNRVLQALERNRRN